MPLRLAEVELIGQLNGLIEKGHLTNRAGQVVETTLEAGLVRMDGMMLYPIIDNIPVLLLDDGIPLRQLNSVG